MALSVQWQRVSLIKQREKALLRKIIYFCSFHSPRRAGSGLADPCELTYCHTLLKGKAPQVMLIVQSSQLMGSRFLILHEFLKVTNVSSKKCQGGSKNNHFIQYYSCRNGVYFL